MQISGFSFRVLLSPYRDANFKRLMYFLAMWGFATHMAIPFISVYMLHVLGMSLTLVMVLTVVGQVSSIYWIRHVGRISDKHGNKPVMALSSGIFALGILLLTMLILLEPKIITLPLLLIIHFLLGLGTAGINLTTANIAAKLSPTGESPSYLASIGATIAAFSGLGALAAAWIIDFVGYSSHFLITFLLILFSLYFILHVKEEGEAPTRIVEKEIMYLIKRDLSNLSTVKEAYRLTPRLFHLPKLKRKRG